jgi:hypothetical protein
VRSAASRYWREENRRGFLQTNGGEAVKLTRTSGTCPACGVGFFPLDEQLGLLSGGLPPRAEETRVRLSRWMPDESARAARRYPPGRQHLRCGKHRWSGSGRKRPKRLREQTSKR